MENPGLQAQELVHEVQAAWYKGVLLFLLGCLLALADRGLLFRILWAVVYVSWVVRVGSALADLDRFVV